MLTQFVFRSLVENLSFTGSRSAVLLTLAIECRDKSVMFLASQDAQEVMLLSESVSESVSE